MSLKSALRQPVFRFNTLPKWDASCEVVLDESSVTCGMFGPMESKSHSAESSGMTVDVTVRPPVGLMTSTERHIESILTDLFPIVVDVSLFPYTQVVTCIEIASVSGSTLSIIINSFLATLQLLGLPMKVQAFSVTCAKVGQAVIVFPTMQEEEDSESEYTCVFDGTSGEVLYSTCDSNGCSLNDLMALHECCNTFLNGIQSDMYPQTVVPSSC